MFLPFKTQQAYWKNSKSSRTKDRIDETTLFQFEHTMKQAHDLSLTQVNIYLAFASNAYRLK